MKLRFILMNITDRLKIYGFSKPFLPWTKGIALSIIPLILLLVWFLFIDSHSTYHYEMVDPEYIYLFNGVVAVEKNMKTDFYDCPGTPMILFTAGVEKLLNVFRDAPFQDDVIRNPETYLKAVNVISIFLLIILLFAGGWMLYNKTRNLFLALLFQSTLLVYNVPHFTSRVLAETIALFFVPILIFQLIHYLESCSYEEKSKVRYAVYFALTIGMLTAVKISIFPLFLIPLLTIRNKKNRLIYLGMTMVFFLIFAYPVLFHLNNFYLWVKSMFMHSGRYGGGENRIVSIPDFVQNMKTLFNTYRLVFYLLFINAAVLFSGILPTIRKRIEFPDDKYRAIIGLTLCIILQTIMVSKHFSLHYFLPVLMMIPFNLYLIIKYLLAFWKFPYARIMESSVYLLAIIFIISSLHRYITTDTRIRYKSVKEKERTVDFVKHNLPGKTVVFNTEAWNPCQEVGIWFGSLFARKYRTFFTDKLNKTYPNRYFYVDSYGSFIDWYNNRFQLNEIIRQYDTIYFFDNRAPAGLSRFLPDSVRTDSIAIDTVYKYPERNETITLFRKTKK
jgi:hypothetical protein